MNKETDSAIENPLTQYSLSGQRPATRIRGKTPFLQNAYRK
jgi:hypothetical protein